MKKQAISKKTVKQGTPTHVVVMHTRHQRFWGILALTGLFVCGLFVGKTMQTPVEKYHQNMQVNQQTEEDVFVSEPRDVCIEVERLLSRRLPAESDIADERIDRAKIYASLAERGCPENSDAYVELARQELDIARAIEDDEFNHQETIDVVETYKRLNMQAAAEEIFEKAKKLTNPAIDFIIQVEKIVNE